MNTRFLMIATIALLGRTVVADSLKGVDQLLCAAGQVLICVEMSECFKVTPAELDMPDFVVIDIRKQTVSTTKTSGLNRSTRFSRVDRADGVITMQGVESARAFSFVVDEATGRMTAAIARDGIGVTVFGACTTTDL